MKTLLAVSVIFSWAMMGSAFAQEADDGPREAPIVIEGATGEISLQSKSAKIDFDIYVDAQLARSGQAAPCTTFGVEACTLKLRVPKGKHSVVVVVVPDIAVNLGVLFSDRNESVPVGDVPIGKGETGHRGYAIDIR